ncbi:MAG: M20/M25/M40 family metallo-hydrolase [Pseudomonadota bacterium]
MSYPHGFNKKEWGEVCAEATALLQSLLRANTTNPPGNEILAATILTKSLEVDGLKYEIIEPETGRANLICRLSSGSSEPALLLASHLDVVPAGDEEKWTHPPFEGRLVNGMIWGRGAIDMKHMVVMSAMVAKLLNRREIKLRRDIVMVAVADEEEGCTKGSRFLVENHSEKVQAGFALGEVGGFPTTAGKVRIMPIQTAEKGISWIKLTAKGTAGHGSIPRKDNPISQLGLALDRIQKKPLPQHNTPVVEDFVRTVAKLQPLPDRLVLPLILNPKTSRFVLEKLFPDKSQSQLFSALLRNTVSPTVLRSGNKTNVIPDQAEVHLDGRILPGQNAEDLVNELRKIIDKKLEIEVFREAPGQVNHPPDSELWDCICEVIGKHRPALPIIPYMIPGFTDAQYFSRLGARWYGFSPVWLESDSGLNFSDLFHGYDERIPEDGFHWGLQVLYEVVLAFCQEK